MPTAPILKLVHQIRPQNTDFKAAVGWGVTAGLAALWLIQACTLASLMPPDEYKEPLKLFACARSLSACNCQLPFPWIKAQFEKPKEEAGSTS